MNFLFLIPPFKTPQYSQQLLLAPYQFTSMESLISVIEQQKLQIQKLTEENQLVSCQLRVAVAQREQLQQTIASENSETLQKVKPARKNYYRSNVKTGEDRLQCPYDGCEGLYGSNLALNFHIKKKHDGGSKKQRQAYAKIIIKAEENGEEPPKLNFNFPPGYLELFRKKYRQNGKTELRSLEKKQLTSEDLCLRSKRLGGSESQFSQIKD